MKQITHVEACTYNYSWQPISIDWFWAYEGKTITQDDILLIWNKFQAGLIFHFCWRASSTIDFTQSFYFSKSHVIRLEFIARNKDSIKFRLIRLINDNTCPFSVHTQMIAGENNFGHSIYPRLHKIHHIFQNFSSCLARSKPSSCKFHN